ncbi:MAG: MBOAT family protein, partial [Butyrivibrio sp.]|nr:MBOAT family protein [Butyrivibrio sp.]
LPFKLPVPQISLPIGISFFTFQAISYVIDCYWETVRPQKTFRKFLLYLSLFPQLIAGPIVRYSVVEEEINKRRSTVNDISEGAMRFIVGLAKKVIIATNLYAVVKQFFGDVNFHQYNDVSSMSFLGTWFVIIAYSLYVYFDFSGYSDMAIGLGRMFGFHFDENFKYPFICKNISEFWQRWHISLSSFFRDYLFYAPIFGRPRKYVNLFLVWFCTGLWHGASWNYIFWGLYFGLFLLLEIKIGKKRMKKWPLVLTHIYSKLVIVLGFGIFCFSDMGQLGNFFANVSGISMLTHGNAFADTLTWNVFLKNMFLLIVAIAVSMPVLPRLKKFFFEWGNNYVYTTGKILGAVGCIYLLVVSSILLVDTTNNPFLYFRF